MGEPKTGRFHFRLRRIAPLSAVAMLASVNKLPSWDLPVCIVLGHLNLSELSAPLARLQKVAVLGED